ncbi:GTPase-activating protein RNA1 [Kluyveromyces lactis]|uniref:KLLA0F25036p n=1 Tax=Kluyveromyces lactis (strain ATCC 8585 / CBS 2359 / DSM 70799 / NBRC 1267 / NRRL Y-1140 / WM37) TaxID=284590 RepID=Q6CIP3_KLULA|nr:uncharacterized protein KLLA0_F25036g [Kluyveromyces lactis]CAG98904.1 KLLA0F25036p [Kluyveromyces lactis]|eukprot:XP_456196.1 uncharacterized protein KLLA0_F25036g [Kluyveromyces lactis]
MSFSKAGLQQKWTSEEDIKSVLDELKSMDKVTSLDLSGNTIGVEASRALAKTIKENASIRDNVEEVNFADMYTSRLVDEVVESLQLLLPALQACPKLSKVDLSDNAFGLRTIDSLEKFIRETVQLKHLILANNGMGPFAGERIGKALYQLAKNKEKAGESLLETFVCGRNRLENGSTRWLSQGLRAHGDDLHAVRLYQNGIRPQGCINLIKHGLSHNKNLHVLDLQDNTFTAVASETLAKYLTNWAQLKELNLNDCLLKGPGSHAVLKVLKENKFDDLETLKLQYNELTQQSLEHLLIPALQDGNLPSLKLLELNGNRLEEDSDPLSILPTLFDGELDELDDLEEIDSEEEEESEDEDAEEEDVWEPTQFVKDETVDELASELAKTHLE